MRRAALLRAPAGLVSRGRGLVRKLVSRPVSLVRRLVSRGAEVYLVVSAAGLVSRGRGFVS